MKTTLLIRLAGPMQSWGTQSRFSVRDTGLEPSKSGVIGLICAALGRTRDQPLSDLAALAMAVRVDREGRLSRDYQTAMDVVKADGSRTGTVTSSRYYLADADFLVGLEGDGMLLEAIDTALEQPRWPLYLGRKAFVPSCPVRVGPPVDGDMLDVLQSRPWKKRRPWDEPREKQLRRVRETNSGGGSEVRYDVPVSFKERTFMLRHVKTDFIPLPQLEDDPCFT